MIAVPVHAKRPPAVFFKPSSDLFTKPFWDAAAEHRLVIAQCTRCGRERMPPTPFCPRCQSTELGWKTLPGSGVVFSYTVVAHPIAPGMEDSLPYVPAVIALDGTEDSRLISNVVDVPVPTVHVGMAVRVVWDEVHGVTVPRFTAFPSKTAAETA